MNFKVLYKTLKFTIHMKNPSDFIQGKSVKSLVLPALLGAMAPFALLLFIVLTKEDVFES